MRTRSAVTYIHSAPACAPCASVFISDPAASRAYITENHGMRLHLEHCRIEQVPVINLPLPVRAFPACPVKPLLEHFTVISECALECLPEYIVIFVRTVMRVIPVPRGNIYAEFQPIFTACQGKFPQDVPFSVHPAALCNSVCAYRVRPQAEPVMMFRRYYYSFHSGSLGGSGPLAAVKVGRSEHVGTFCTVSPFRAGESVRAEMHEHVGLHFLPFHLCFARQGPIRLRSSGST